MCARHSMACATWCALPGGVGHTCHAWTMPSQERRDASQRVHCSLEPRPCPSMSAGTQQAWATASRRQVMCHGARPFTACARPCSAALIVLRPQRVGESARALMRPNACVRALTAGWSACRQPIMGRQDAEMCLHRKRFQCRGQLCSRPATHARLQQTCTNRLTHTLAKTPCSRSIERHMRRPARICMSAGLMNSIRTVRAPKRITVSTAASVQRHCRWRGKAFG